MPITPIDAKTTILTNNDASRLRENQKTHEMGQAPLVAQNQEKNQEKVETIHHTEAAEHKVIRKEDEDAERDKGHRDPSSKQSQPDEQESPEKPKSATDSVRGSKIDIKA